MSRAVIYEKFGGPEVLELHDVPEPHAGPGEIRVRVAAVGLNPMDPAIAATPELAARFNITVPSGFGYDFAGVVDEVGDGASGFTVGERVYGGVMERAAADYIVIETPADASRALLHTPEGLSDEIASTLAVAGTAASAALAAIDLKSHDTVLIGGAAGGVGVFAVQLAKLAGATVIGTASEGTFPFLRELGAEPVTYGAGLTDRVRALAPDGITAAVDLFGTETIETALALGVAPDRISAIAAGPAPPGGAHPAFSIDAEPGSLPRIADAIVAGQITVPIAARLPIEQIREAATLQAGRHVHGKIVITLNPSLNYVVDPPASPPERPRAAKRQRVTRPRPPRVSQRPNPCASGPSRYRQRNKGDAMRPQILVVSTSQTDNTGTTSPARHGTARGRSRR